jgi:outer membrane protein assembly factor BamB
MRRAAAVLTIVVVLAGCAWARPRFDAAKTGRNPLEVSISRDNVSALRESFRVSAPTSIAVAPDVVVARNHLYVSGGPSAVFDAFGVEGCSGSPRTCAPQWTVDGSYFPDVVGSTLYHATTAFDADGVEGCGGTPKVCRPLWFGGRDGSPTGPVDPATLQFGFAGFGGHGWEDTWLRGYPLHPELDDCVPSPSAGAPECPEAWARYLGGSPNGSTSALPAVADGRVFTAYTSVVTDHGTLYALDGRDATGPTLWSALLPGENGPDLAVAEGVVVATVHIGLDRQLAAYDAAGVTNCSGAPKVCTPLWVSDIWTGGGDEAAPAIADGIVYRAVGSQLRAYDLHGQQNCSGTPVVCQRLWVASVGNGITAPAVANGLVYVGSADGHVEAFDARGITGCSATTRACGPLWTANVGAAVGNVVVSAGRVYVPTTGGVVRVFGLP